MKIILIVLVLETFITAPLKLSAKNYPHQEKSLHLLFFAFIIRYITLLVV